MICPCRRHNANANTKAKTKATTADTPAYAACCGRYHAGPLHLRAPTAEALMRSRYSAFVLDEIDYLMATWHVCTRPVMMLTPNPPGLKWSGLDVRRHTVIDADHATVEFVAHHKLGGRAERLHEISHFVREVDRWFYVDADVDAAIDNAAA